MTFTELRTERLLIRRWSIDEAPQLFEIRRIPEVAKWLSNPSPWTTVVEAEEAIDTWNVRIAADDVLGHWAVVPHGEEPVGAVSLQLTPDDAETTIGWYLHPDAGGQGFAREAAQALLAVALEADGVDRVWAVMFPDNGPSANVALALGMTDLGVVEDQWYGEPDAPTSRMFCSYADGSTG